MASQHLPDSSRIRGAWFGRRAVTFLFQAGLQVQSCWAVVDVFSLHLTKVFFVGRKEESQLPTS
jgi:hypothetical protein